MLEAPVVRPATLPDQDRFMDTELLDDVRFAERFLFVVPKAGATGGIVPLRANKAQQYIAKHWSNRLLILKARQLGCSTWIQARFFRKTITDFGVHSVIIAHKPDTTGALMEISKTYYQFLPEHMRPALKYDNTRRMVFGRLRSTLACGSADKAGFGHGLTVHNLHASELALWPHPEMFNGMRQSVPLHDACDIVVESTANGATGLFYEMCIRALERQGPWRLLFLPWWLDEGYRMELKPGESLEPYDTDEERLIREHGLSAEQIKWRRYQLVSYASSGDREEFFQDYAEDPLTCFLSGGNCFFDVVKLRVLLKQGPPAPMFVDEGGWHIYREPQIGHRYVMGVDTASGDERGDYSAAVIRDARTNERVAVLNEHITPFQLAVEAARAGLYYNDALLGIERNGMGLSTIEKVIELGYEQLYWHADKKVGWPTNSTTRFPMLADLRQEVADVAASFNDRRLLNQMLRFLKARGVGDIPKAGTGAHDDLVMADAIAGQIRKLAEPGAAVV